MCCQRHHLGHRGQRHGARGSGSAGRALAAEMARELAGRGGFALGQIFNGHFGPFQVPIYWRYLPYFFGYSRRVYQLCKEISLENLALDGTVPLF